MKIATQKVEQWISNINFKNIQSLIATYVLVTLSTLKKRCDATRRGVTQMKSV